MAKRIKMGKAESHPIEASKGNYNKPKAKPKATPPKPKAKPKAAPPKPRAKPARKATPPKPRAKPTKESPKGRGGSKDADKLVRSASEAASKATRKPSPKGKGGRGKPSTASDRAGRKYPKSNTSRKSDRMR